MMETQASIKVVSYVRESTKNQMYHGYRPETQRNVIQGYCERHNFKIVKKFQDAGSGGGVTKRPQFLEMINFVKEHNDIHFIVFHQANRFFRNLRDTLNFEKELQEKHGIFAIDTEVDTFPRGYLVSDGVSVAQWKNRMMTRVDAEEERKHIQQRVKEGYKGKAERGQYTGPMAYGLKWGDENKKFVKHIPEEIGVVQRIFRLYNTGNFGFTGLAKRLNEEGYIRRVRIQKEKKLSEEETVLETVVEERPFVHDTIRKILSNRSYIGERNTPPHLKLKTLNEEGVLTTLEPAVSFDDFNRAQEQMSRNGRGISAVRGKKTSRQKSTFLFQGIGFSGINGARLHGQTESNNKNEQRVRRYFASTNKKGIEPHIPSFRADEVESKVIELLRDIRIKSPKEVETMLKESLKDTALSSKSIVGTSSLERGYKNNIKNLEELQQHSFSIQIADTIKELKRKLDTEQNQKTKKSMKYYLLLELQNLLGGIHTEFMQMKDLVQKHSLLNILFSEFFVGNYPDEEGQLLIHRSGHMEYLKEDGQEITEAKQLKGLIQKFVPHLFEKIYIKKEREVVSISFKPTGLFLLLADIEKPKEEVSKKKTVH